MIKYDLKFKLPKGNHYIGYRANSTSPGKSPKITSLKGQQNILIPQKSQTELINKKNQKNKYNFLKETVNSINKKITHQKILSYKTNKLENQSKKILINKNKGKDIKFEFKNKNGQQDFLSQKDFLPKSGKQNSVKGNEKVFDYRRNEHINKINCLKEANADPIEKVHSENSFQKDKDGIIFKQKEILKHALLMKYDQVL